VAHRSPRLIFFSSLHPADASYGLEDNASLPLAQLCKCKIWPIGLVRNSLQFQEAQMQLGQQLSESRSRMRELRMAKEVS